MPKVIGMFILLFLLIECSSCNKTEAPTTPLPSPPLVKADQPATIRADSATLTGTVNPNGLATSFHFEFDTTKLFRLKTPEQNAGSGSSPLNVTATINSLSPSTTYYFRLAATNTAGTSLAEGPVFKTGMKLPDVIAGEVTNIIYNSAILAGTVNPNGSRTSYHFEYDTTTSFRTKTPEVDIGSLSTPLGVNAKLSNLSPSTIYYYRLVATNTGGTSSSEGKLFRTDDKPPPKTFIFPCAIGNTWTYQYSGNVVSRNSVKGVHTWKVIESEASGGWRLMDIRQDTTVYGTNPPYFTTDSVYFSILIRPDSIIVNFPEWSKTFPETIRFPVSFTSYTDTINVGKSEPSFF